MAPPPPRGGYGYHIFPSPAFIALPLKPNTNKKLRSRSQLLIFKYLNGNTHFFPCKEIISTPPASRLTFVRQ